MATLLRLWRTANRPVIHVRHMSSESDSPLRPGQPGNEFKEDVLPFQGEYILAKRVNSAFIGTTLETYLRERNYDTLVIVGISTDHCVSTTARMAGNLGFKVYVVADACHTFDRTGHDGVAFDADQIHSTALASLHQEFATVVQTKDLAARSLPTA